MGLGFDFGFFQRGQRGKVPFFFSIIQQSGPIRASPLERPAQTQSLQAGTALPITWRTVILNKRNKGMLTFTHDAQRGQGRGGRKTSCSRFITSGHRIISKFFKVICDTKKKNQSPHPNSPPPNYSGLVPNFAFIRELASSQIMML